MGLAAIVAVVLAAAAPALADSGSANNSGKLVDIGGAARCTWSARAKDVPP